MTQTIPLAWYSSEAVLESEKKLLRKMPQYRGHASMVPKLNDYHTLASTQNTQMLIHNQNGAQVLSNLCRHRHAVMLEGRGNQKSILCPAHCWRYSPQGELLNAPYFEKIPKLPLHPVECSSWQGLLFETSEPVASHIDSPHLNRIMDFSSYAFHSSQTLTCNYNWKTFIETYLEIYHVKAIHPGLRNFIDCDELKWSFGEKYSSQSVRIHPSWKTHGGSPSHQIWQSLLCQYNQNENPPYGAEWMLYYPNTMIEHYPHAIVVSVVTPDTPSQCTNYVDFYHPQSMVDAKHPYCKAFQDAYLETAGEDDVICQKMDAGRKACLENNQLESGPFQTPLEDGIAHFHNFWVREMNSHQLFEQAPHFRSHVFPGQGIEQIGSQIADAIPRIDSLA